MVARSRLARLDWMLVALLATTVALGLLSVVLRGPCLALHSSGPGTLTGSGCFSDLQVMWFDRGLADHQFPYQQPMPGSGAGHSSGECPVLGGLLMWLLSLTARTYAGFVWANTLVMVAAAAGITAILYRSAGRLAWLWAAAPALVFYLGYNFDALPALCLWLFFGRPGPGQAPLGERLASCPVGRSGALAVVLGANLPFALGNGEGWLGPIPLPGRPRHRCQHGLVVVPHRESLPRTQPACPDDGTIPCDGAGYRPRPPGSVAGRPPGGTIPGRRRRRGCVGRGPGAEPGLLAAVLHLFVAAARPDGVPGRCAALLPLARPGHLRRPQHRRRCALPW